jgi:protein-tyrosine phosphatase
MSELLFLCTGNFYRSRFAEEVFNKTRIASSAKWTASSRGLAVDICVNNVGPIHRAAEDELRRLGIVLSEPRMPLQVTLKELQNADRIVLLKAEEHLPLLQQRFPAWLEAEAHKMELWQIHDTDVSGPAEQLPLIHAQTLMLLNTLAREAQEIH